MVSVMGYRAAWRRAAGVVVLGGMLFSGCVGTIRVPGVLVDIEGDSVHIDLTSGTIRVSDDRVMIDLPGVDVDVRG